MSEQDEIIIEEPKKKSSSIIQILLFVAILLAGVTVMIVISNTVFNIRSSKIEKIQQEIWAPSLAKKAKALQTFDLESIQVNLSDPTGNNPVFLKVELALAYPDQKNIELSTELTNRKYQIRDKLIRLIAVKTYDDLNTADKVLSLKKEVMNQVNSILIHGVIEDVYVNSWNIVRVR